MVVVVAAATAFVYLSLRENLDDGIDATLQARADALASATRGSDAPLGGGPAVRLDEADESFAQVVTPDGRVLDTIGNVGADVLNAAELGRAGTGEIVVERRVPGIEATTRVLARPVSEGGDSPLAIVGQSLDDRDETLAGLLASFALGGPMAVALACLIGYVLATVGLRPMEAMRRRAAGISLERGAETLPLPAARDEVRRLGETLNDMLGRLRGSFERERRFVADASHELRTPVAVVKAELEGALRRGGFGPEVREALVAAAEECDHLAQLAEDLLVIARAADGRLPVRREPIGAGTLLEGVRRRFADRTAERGREVRVDAPEGLVLHADPLRLRQALGNLVDNALRHGAGEVRLAARSRGAEIELEVADRGPGFAAGVAEHAFERFTRGDEARGRTGTGLGLAIVQAVAEAHGGRAVVVPGSGATVRIYLPGRAAGSVGEAAPEAPEGRARRSQAGLSQPS